MEAAQKGITRLTMDRRQHGAGRSLATSSGPIRPCNTGKVDVISSEVAKILQSNI